jgi:hypothetical protein
LDSAFAGLSPNPSTRLIMLNNPPPLLADLDPLSERRLMSIVACAFGRSFPPVEPSRERWLRSRGTTLSGTRAERDGA